MVGHLIAHSSSQRERATILELGVQSTVQAEQNMPLTAPMISQVARAVFNHSDSYSTELAGAPVCRPGFAGVSSGLYFRPIGGAKGDVGELHGCLGQGRKIKRTEVP